MGVHNRKGLHIIFINPWLECITLYFEWRILGRRQFKYIQFQSLVTQIARRCHICI